MLLGYPAGARRRAQHRHRSSSPFYAWTNYYGVYAQDDWRVGPKFTLNYGISPGTRRRPA